MYQFKKPARPVTRVFLHCSASDNPAHDNVATMRQWHLQRGWSDVGYHFFIRKNGTLELGRSLEKIPAAQYGHNTATIAICLHGLKDEKFTEAQFETLRALVGQINLAYHSAITFHGHCEVAAKACPVFKYREILRLHASGQLINSFSAPVALQSPAPEEDVARQREITLRRGDRGVRVTALQRALIDHGYHVGKVDGHFGNLTQSAVLSLQADNHLIADGIVGPNTWEALDQGYARPLSNDRQKEGVVSLAANGSRIAKSSIANTVLGSTVGVGGAVGAIEQSTGMISKLASSAGVYGDVLEGLGPWIGGAILIVGILIVVQSIAAGRARVEDHRTGKTL